MMLRFPFPNSSCEWHRWFAWRPVFVDYDGGTALVWLESVERKFDQGLVGLCSSWHYRLVGDGN